MSERITGVPEDFDAQISRILYHRYCYYVLNAPEIDDFAYDLLERALPKVVRDSLGIGSELESSYPSSIIIEASLKHRR